jgi:hypothetical protein
MSEDAPVNTGVVSWPDPYSAGVAVRRMQTKLHLWAARDPGRRFGRVEVRPNRSILTSTASGDRPASSARSTNIDWSHDVDEVFGSDGPTCNGLICRRACVCAGSVSPR